MHEFNMKWNSFWLFYFIDQITYMCKMIGQKAKRSEYRLLYLRKEAGIDMVCKHFLSLLTDSVVFLFSLIFSLLRLRASLGAKCCSSIIHYLCVFKQINTNLNSPATRTISHRLDSRFLQCLSKAFCKWCRRC